MPYRTFAITEAHITDKRGTLYHNTINMQPRTAARLNVVRGAQGQWPHADSVEVQVPADDRGFYITPVSDFDRLAVELVDVHGRPAIKVTPVRADDYQPSEYRDAFDALGVIAADPKIRAYLAENDPKALEQVDAALREEPTLKLKGWSSK